MPEPAPTPSAARSRTAVGRQVRRWRNKRVMSLAQASGLNVGYLSQIENDKASPSLESLAAIGGALEVPSAWFLMDGSTPPRVVRAADRPAFRGEGGIGIAEV